MDEVVHRILTKSHSLVHDLADVEAVKPQDRSKLGHLAPASK